MQSTEALSNELAKRVEIYIDGLLEHLASHLKEKVTEDEIRAAAQSYTGEMKRSLKNKSAKAKADQPALPDKLTLVYHYGPASDALFGMKTKELNENKFFEKLNAGKKWLRFHGGLAFGKGWLITDQSRIEELENALTAAGIEYDAMTREEYEDKLKENGALPNETADQQGESEEPTEKVPAVVAKVALGKGKKNEKK